MRYAGEAILWVFPVSPNSAASSKFGSATSIKRAHPASALRNNAVVHVVAMDAVFPCNEKLTRQMLEEIFLTWSKRWLRPFPSGPFLPPALIPRFGSWLVENTSEGCGRIPTPFVRDA